jgi:hypothetical protein
MCDDATAECLETDMMLPEHVSPWLRRFYRKNETISERNMFRSDIVSFAANVQRLLC